MGMKQKSKKLEVAHLRLLRQHQNMKGNDSTHQGKTKHTPTKTSCNIKPLTNRAV